MRLPGLDLINLGTISMAGGTLMLNGSTSEVISNRPTGLIIGVGNVTHTVINNGTIRANNAAAIWFDNLSGSNTIINNETGVIQPVSQAAELARARGIPVGNVPDYGTTEVADSAIAIMLTFARGTAALDTALRQDLKGGWTHVHNVTARRLRGLTYGVIGLGRIGSEVARRAKAFNLRVLAYDPYITAEAAQALG